MTQTGMILSESAAPDDSFGALFAVEGDLLVVSAAGADDAGNNSGAAYLYDWPTGLGTMELVAGDRETGCLGLGERLELGRFRDGLGR